jgi:hypothetical protein
VFSLLLVVLAAPGKGAAASSSLPNRASLFVVSREAAEASGAVVEVELRKALEERSVALTDLESLFPDELPPNKGAALMKEGLDGVDNLDFEAASTRFTEALAFWNQNPALGDAREISNAHLHLANIALQTAGKPGQKTAADNIGKALISFPALELDPKYFGPDVKKLVDKGLVELNKAPKALLKITSMPLGAEVTFRGAVLGFTPLKESLTVPVGRHLVTVKRPGFRPAGAFVTVSKEGAEASLELSEAEGYGPAIKTMKGLVPANLGKGVPRESKEIAEKMKSRFLIVTEVGSGGEGQLEVWDVETKARLKDVALPTDGNFGPVVDKVKAFLANPSPVAVAKSANPEITATSEPASGDSVFSKWWFWTAVGVVVVGGASAGIGVAASQSQPAAPARPYNPVLPLL